MTSYRPRAPTAYVGPPVEGEAHSPAKVGPPVQGNVGGGLVREVDEGNTCLGEGVGKWAYGQEPGKGNTI